MRVEPLLDRTALIEQLRREYAIEIVALTFLPKGFASHCYIAEDASGLRYFVKLCADTRIGRRNATLLDVSLPLLAALHQPDLFPNAPVPVKTVRGEFKSYFDGMACAVTYFIEGDTLVPDAPVSDVVLAKIAQAAARIHCSTDALDVSNLPVERFAIPIEDDLREGLAALETLTAQDSPASHALRDLLLPRRDEVLRHLERLRGL